MSAHSIVKQATANSRRAVAIALSGAALMSAALITERVLYQSDQSVARDQLVEAHGSIGMLMLADQQQIMAANMAVATGDERWITLYDQTTPLIQSSVETALGLAPPEVAQELVEAAGGVENKLEALAQSAFEAARAGDLEGARAILEGPEYVQARAELAAGGAKMLDGVIGTAEDRIRNRDARATITLISIILLAFISGLLFWRVMSRGLTRTEAALSSAEDTIRELAQTDVLTGLANRRALLDRLRAAIGAATGSRGSVTAMMVDLDRFKPINDRYGHVTGDLVLKEIAHRLRSTLRHGQFAARIGGDEFVVVIETDTPEPDIKPLADRIIGALSKPIEVDGVTVRVGATIGTASYPVDTTEAEDLLRMADVALYAGKAAGRGRSETYTRALDADVEARARVEDELNDAIENDAIVPYFQPLVDLNTGRVTGFEALSRWRHPDRGLLNPSHFIPAAERCGLIDELTVASLRAACVAARDLPPDMKLAFNISPQQIEDDWLAEKIMSVLVGIGFPPSQLEIELTENALVNDLAAAKRVITSLKNLGVSIALDDFGTGYSSLCYLSELPFDKIKIDRSFVSSMRERPESAKIVSAIIGLGHSLGVTTVAEGVEDEADAKILRDLGCAQAQGWLYARALPAEDAMEIVCCATSETSNVVPMRRA